VLGVVNGVGSIGAGGSFNLGQIGGILGSLNGLANASYTTNHVYSPTDNSWASQQLIASGNALAGTQGSALAAYQDYRTHAAALQALRDHLATATTPKEVQDTQAQMEIENIWTANQNGQMAALQVAATTQELERAQRDNEGLDKSIDDFIAQANAAGRGTN
jgi:hypothetical protein